MKELFFNTIQEFNDFIGVKTLHPLVSIARVENTSPIQEAVHHYGLYALFLKENKGCKLSYGRTEYDFDEMTVTSFAPGQSIKVEPIPGVPFAKYTVLAFHPELLNRTQLGKNISRYEFFDYTSNEALHLSADEVNIFRDVLSMIKQELQHPIDKHSRELIVSNIELLLNYCLRFYDRQFITREEINHSVVKMGADPEKRRGYAPKTLHRLSFQHGPWVQFGCDGRCSGRWCSGRYLFGCAAESGQAEHR